MSNKERIIELLDSIPDYKRGYVLAYVQVLAADEEADDIFCQRMLENYQNAPEAASNGTETDRSKTRSEKTCWPALVLFPLPGPGSGTKQQKGCRAILRHPVNHSVLFLLSGRAVTVRSLCCTHIST